MNYDFLILMPQLFHGGAEKQFRYLFCNTNNSYIAVINHDKNDNDSIEFINEYKDRLYVQYLSHTKYLPYLLLIFFNVIKALIHFTKIMSRNRFVIFYGAETRWLLLYPVVKLLGYKILFSERNDGLHKFKPLYRIINKCEIITTNSIEAKGILQKNNVSKEVYLINNGIEIPKPPFKRRTADNILRIIVPARIHPLKNQKIVILALQEINNIEVHFVGKIDDETYFADLQNMIKVSKCCEKFIFDGYISNISEYYRDFDVVLLSSLSEGTPNVLLEGMALNIPCIASDIEQNKRVIRTSRFLFNKNSATSLRNVVKSFRLMTISDIEDVTESNKKFIRANYSIEHMVSSYINLMNDTFKEN